MTGHPYRRSVNKKKSATSFNKQSKRTNRKNTKSGPMRGGIRT